MKARGRAAVSCLKGYQQRWYRVVHFREVGGGRTPNQRMPKNNPAIRIIYVAVQQRHMLECCRCNKLPTTHVCKKACSNVNVRREGNAKHGKEN